MQRALTLAYLGIEVPDPTALTPFWAEVVGLVPGDPSPGGPQTDRAVTWRNDDRSHRVVIEAGPAGDATYVAFEAADAEAFDRTVARLAAAGFAVDEGSAADRARRRVDRLARTSAPWGVAVEIVQGLAPAATPCSTPLVPGGFLTRDVGFGHVVFATTAFEESNRFLVEGLGMVRSDWLETEIMAGVELEVRFFHCNERHHTVALARAPFALPQTLHHLMVETRRRDDVGAAFDRAWASGLPIPNGLGRHDNDGMFSFYVTSPAGFAVEVGYGARTITDDWDDDRRYDRISAWGHQALR
jgi:2,3-dihydroxybiphenyl 1,2-dioxygenase